MHFSASPPKYPRCRHLLNGLYRPITWSMPQAIQMVTRHTLYTTMKIHRHRQQYRRPAQYSRSPRSLPRKHIYPRRRRQRSHDHVIYAPNWRRKHGFIKSTTHARPITQVIQCQCDNAKWLTNFQIIALSKRVCACGRAREKIKEITTY